VQLTSNNQTSQVQIDVINKLVSTVFTSSLTMILLIKVLQCCRRLIGCQDLLEDIPSRSSKRDNLTTGPTSPPEYKSLPRPAKSVYGSRSVSKYYVKEELCSKLFVFNLYNSVICVKQCYLLINYFP
jgi:hypothetical protein